MWEHVSCQYEYLVALSVAGWCAYVHLTLHKSHHVCTQASAVSCMQIDMEDAHRHSCVSESGGGSALMSSATTCTDLWTNEWGISCLCSCSPDHAFNSKELWKRGSSGCQGLLSWGLNAEAIPELVSCWQWDGGKAQI